MDLTLFLQDQEHDDGKGQLTIAGEILRPHAMTSQEERVAPAGAEDFDQSDKVSRKITQNGLHPACDRANSELVLYKYNNFNDLWNSRFLTQWQ